MRLLRICSAGLYTQQYEEYISLHVSSEHSYEDALDILHASGMLYPANFSREMNVLGIDAQDIVPDVLSMQLLWKKQYGATGDSILFDQIQKYAPDIIYFQELDVIPHAIRKSLKEKFPFIKVITGFKGFPPRLFSDYCDLDHVFISYPYFQQAWKDIGVSTTLLPHCFDPGTMWNPERIVQKYDFTFVGSTGFGNLAQEGRYNDIKVLLGSTPLEVWGKEPDVPKIYLFCKGVALSLARVLPNNVLEKFRSMSFIKPGKLNVFLRDALLVQKKKIEPFEWYIHKKPLQKLYPKRLHVPVIGREYLSVLASSKISLNRHTDEPWEGGNIRTFEATGCGTCLLTDQRPNLDQLFRDNEIVKYTSIEDARDKVKYLLAHPHETAAIAARGHTRTLLEHTTRSRVSIVAKVLTGLL